ncbi:COMM domain-containing protein 6 isoform X1 [Bubalus kerabau]|uniref:COMM domain-containing protein 6 isoform X1 n=2 Tax=Bubalus carabanensis TaxID=3119969 RepID=UPI00244EFCD8|nr:COMM domain-containing protein 6 isoform X1 [Bubalus carabanensis]
MVRALNRAMEESSEPQLDAKSKVTNQVSEWPSSPVPRPALLGKGWATEPGPSPAAGSCGRCHREPFLARPSTKLIDFEWKLGMAVSSDSCRSLKYPYVAVMLKVADHSGQVKNKSFEMTIAQFQNFYRQFKEIAAIIETV